LRSSIIFERVSSGRSLRVRETGRDGTAEMAMIIGGLG
jgi:hypothetical protein